MFGNLVRAHGVARRDLRRHDPAGEDIGADIDDDAPFKRQDQPVVVVANFERRIERARMGRGLQVFKTILDPLDRTPQHAARVRDQDLFEIRPRFGAEAATDIFRDDANVVFRNAEQHRQILPNRIVNLGRNP